MPQSRIRCYRRNTRFSACLILSFAVVLNFFVIGINAFRAMTGSLVGNVGAEHLSWAMMPTETDSFEKFQKDLFHIRLLHPVIPCTMLTVSTDF